MESVKQNQNYNGFCINVFMYNRNWVRLHFPASCAVSLAGDQHQQENRRGNHMPPAEPELEAPEMVVRPQTVAIDKVVQVSDSH